MRDIDANLPVGVLSLRIFSRGELIEEWGGTNLVMDMRRNIHAHLLGGDVANMSVSRVGFGTGANAPNAGNTSLTDAFIKNLDGVTFPSYGKVLFAFSLLAGEANGKAISEFGLYTALGALYARKVRGTPLIKTADISLLGNWSITF